MYCGAQLSSASYSLYFVNLYNLRSSEANFGHHQHQQLSESSQNVGPVIITAWGSRKLIILALPAYLQIHLPFIFPFSFNAQIAVELCTFDIYEDDFQYNRFMKLTFH